MPDANGSLVKRIDMANHFAEICAEHGITVKFTLAEPNEGAYWARPHKKLIQTRPIRNTGFYVSGLHEIGHCVSRGQTGNVLANEWDAWQWAKEHAIVWTDTASRIMRQALSGYESASSRSVRFGMPTEFHNFMTGTQND